MRAVIDVNVLVAALLSPGRAPARLLLRWLEGEFDLIFSEKLLSELRRALSYPKIRSHMSASEASAFVRFLEVGATWTADPDTAPRRSRDTGDDYLLALAASSSAVVVSGDRDLLALSADLPIYSPSAFVAVLGD